MTQAHEASHEGGPGMLPSQLPAQAVGGSSHTPTLARGRPRCNAVRPLKEGLQTKLGGREKSAKYSTFCFKNLDF